MKDFKMIIYWASFAYYVYVFGYASLYKVFQKKSMMQNMQALGFNKVPTILIGICELAGVVLGAKDAKDARERLTTGREGRGGRQGKT